jgi:hypothetical protein
MRKEYQETSYLESAHIDNESLKMSIKKIKYRWCFEDDWESFSAGSLTQPNLFHRLMQRLVLGICWREEEEL